MSVSLLGLVALVSLISVLAYRYRAGRHHPASRPDDSPTGAPTVSVYGEECSAVRTAGDALYVTGSGVLLMEGDTIRLDGRAFTVTELRRSDGRRGDGVLVAGLSELP